MVLNIITFRYYYICGYGLNVSVIWKPLRLLSPDHCGEFQPAATLVSSYYKYTLSEM